MQALLSGVYAGPPPKKKKTKKTPKRNPATLATPPPPARGRAPRAGRLEPRMHGSGVRCILFPPPPAAADYPTGWRSFLRRFPKVRAMPVSKPKGFCTGKITKRGTERIFNNSCRWHGTQTLATMRNKSFSTSMYKYEGTATQNNTAS